MAQIKIIETGEVIEVAAQPEWVNGIWECGDVRFTDPEKTLYAAVVESPQAPKLSPIEFELLFTMQEQVSIEQSNDPYVKKFNKLIQDQKAVNAYDPTRGMIDLGLSFVREAIAYLVSINMLTQARADIILVGGKI